MQHVIQHREPGDQVELLEDEPYAAAVLLQLTLGELGDVGASNYYLALAGDQEAIEGAQEGALPRSRTPNDRHEIPLGDGQAHVGEGLKGPPGGLKGLRDVLDLDHRKPYR